MAGTDEQREDRGWLWAIGGPRTALIAAAVSAVLVATWWLCAHRGAPCPLQWVGVVLGWLVLAVALRMCVRVRRPGVWIVAVLLAAVMAMMRVLGGRFDNELHPPYRHTGVSPWWEFLVDWVIAIAVTCVLLDRLARPRPVRSRPLGQWQKLAWWCVAAAVMLLAWSPYLAAYWPGIVVRDSWSSIRIGTGMQPLNNHHPILFSLFVGLCMKTAVMAVSGGFTGGTAVFSLIQAVLFAAGLAIAVVWLRYRGGRWFAVLALLWLALDPSVAMWSITMQKDSLFSLVVTLVTVLLAEAGLRGWSWLLRPWPLIGFLAGLVALSFTRNNGTYIAAFLVGMISLFLLPRLLRPLRRGWRWWTLPISAAVVMVAILGVQGPGYRRAGVEPSDFVEAAGLPLQQLAWANRYGTLTPDQQRTLSNLMPLEWMRQDYNPSLSDNIKFDPRGFDNTWLNHHQSEFIRTWAGAFAANRTGYGLSWYALAGRYLDPGSVFLRVDPGTTRGAGSIVIHQRDRLAAATGGRVDADDLLAAARYAATNPVTGISYRMPLVIWAAILAMCSALLARRPRGALAFLPLVGVVLTLLIAAPITDFRYVGAGHVGLPVLLLALWAGAHGCRRDGSVPDPESVSDPELMPDPELVSGREAPSGPGEPTHAGASR